MAAATSSSSARWTKKNLPRAILILGAESALREEAIAMVKTVAFGSADAKDANIVTLHGPASANEAQTLTPADILDETNTASMFAAEDELKVVLVRQADVFLTDKDYREIFERAIENIPATSTLVLEASNYGQFKTTRLYKQLAAQNAAVECDSLVGKFGDTQELEHEVEQRARKKGLSLPHGALRALLARSSKSLGVIEEELGKLALALEAQPDSTVAVTEEQIEELCATTATFNAFNFADALLDRNARTALEVLGAIFERGLADSKKPGKVVTNEGALTMVLLGALTWKLSQLQDVQSQIDQGRGERDAFVAGKVFGPGQDSMRRVLRKHNGTSIRRCVEALYRAYLDLRLSRLGGQAVMEQMVWRMIKS
jgi:DNA polymerase III delta subunit